MEQVEDNKRKDDLLLEQRLENARLTGYTECLKDEKKEAKESARASGLS